VNLTLLAKLFLHAYTKGVPNGIDHLPLTDVEKFHWNILREDLPLPLAILKSSALTHNSQWMKAFIEQYGAVIAPHGKTTMSPQLFQMQCDDGAWGITIANLHQLKVCRAFGFSRVMMANQLIGKQALNYVMAELERDPDFDFYCLTDSVEHVHYLAAVAAQYRRPLKVLLECGYEHGRAGCRDQKAVTAVLEALAQHPACLHLCGVEGFEGNIHGDHDQDTLARIHQYLNFIVDTAKMIEERHAFASDRIILTAGGTAYYDLAIEALKKANLSHKTQIIIRSGCYLLHDSAYYDHHFKNLVSRNEKAAAMKPGMQHALEVWSYVQSMPEPLLAILNFGKRDASFDVTMPVPLYGYRPGTHGQPQPLSADYEILKMDDQHAFLKIPAYTELRVGDMVACGVSHPCTTFDKWQWLPIVDDDYQVKNAIMTFF
jgi:D-serine dehydratase